VGFTTLNARDSSRTQPDGAGRPIQIALWYPASKNATSRLTYRDYVALTATERTVQAATPAQVDSAVAAFKETVVGQGAAAAAVDALLANPVYAVRDAPAERGRFPVVLIAQGIQESAYHQAVLAEVLASQGFVVATSPGPARTVAPQPNASVYDVALEQARDLEFIRSRLAGDERANAERVGLISYGSGGRGALLMAKDPRVLAFISLDGAIGSAEHSSWLNGKDFSAASVTAYVLHFYQSTDENIRPDFSTIEKMTLSDRTVIRIADMRGAHFSSLGNAIEAVPGFQLGPPSPEVLRKFEAMFRLMNGLLHQRLNNDASRYPSGLPRFLSVRRLSAGGDD
jgi:dienelactone hydrolase